MSSKNEHDEIKQKLDKVETALAQIEQLSNSLTAAGKNAAVINSAAQNHTQQKQAIENTLSEIDELKTSVQSSHDAVENDIERITTFRKSIPDIEHNYKTVVETFQGHDVHVKDVVKQADLANIEANKILGKATTIGLSDAFHKRKVALNGYRILAYLAFSVCLICIVGILIYSFPGSVTQENLRLSDALFSFLKILPWLIAPTWGAIVFYKAWS